MSKQGDVEQKTVGLKRSLLVLAVSLHCGAATAATVDLRIMETTDIHVHLVDYDYYSDKASTSLSLASAHP